MMTRVVGLDFDNTIVSYDEVIFQTAVERGLIEASADVNKRSVRDRIRQLPDGEVEWQKVQALIYGPLMSRAQLIEGVSDFVRACREQHVPVYIVSHKTEFAGYDSTKTNLRAAALAWMVGKRFFEPEGLGLRVENVFFESTREAKIARINAIGCSHFVDDLEEVFLEPSFPASVEKLLYAPDPSVPVGPLRIEATVMRSWQAIRDHVFHHHA